MSWLPIWRQESSNTDGKNRLVFCSAKYSTKEREQSDNERERAKKKKKDHIHLSELFVFAASCKATDNR